MRLTWLLPLLLCALPEVAQAQSSIWEERTVVEEPQEKRPAPARPSPFAERPVVIMVHVGVGTPYGLAGVSGAYSFIPHLALEAGIGTNAMGVQLASKLHARFLPASTATPFFAVGYSQGRHVQDEGRFEGLIMANAGHDDTKYLPRTWSPARWLDIETGYERQFKDGFNLRFYGGVAHLLNIGDATGEAPPADSGRVNLTIKVTQVLSLLPYVGLSLGKGF